MNRRTWLAALAGIAVLGPVSAMAQPAGDYPNRPIKLIVPQAAGAGIDIHARLIAQKLGPILGQQVFVENRPGANAIIGVDAVAKAAPDGYTLIYAPVSSITTNGFIYSKLPYDSLRDFVPITQTTANPLGAIANPASGINSLKDLIDRAKADPGKLNYGSFGIGNLTHLMGVLLSIAADIKMTHVPYRGQTPMITDILSGQIPMGFSTTAGVADLVATNKLKFLAIFGDKRDEQFPDVPTPTELGYPSVVVVGWSGMLAPAGTSPQIVTKLHDAVARILTMPDVTELILKNGSKPAPSKTPEDFTRYIKAEMEKFHPVIKAAGLENSQ